MIAEAALHAGALALLHARGAERAGALFEAATLLVCPSPETWQIGEREVVAQRIALLVDAPTWVELLRDGELSATIKQALADAVASFHTVLAEMPLFLRLPQVAQGWSSVYRSAHVTEVAAPSAREVQSGAVALALAMGEERARRMLDEGWVELAGLPDAAFDGTRLLRVVIHLKPADVVAIERDARLFGVVTAAVRTAATSAAHRVTEVAVGVAG